MNCQCGADITDPVKRFGPPPNPMCWDCYSDPGLDTDERRNNRNVYQLYVDDDPRYMDWLVILQAAVEAGR
jgi:hypothetical protein